MSKNSYAIFVGINHYDDKDLHNLLYAEKDCEDIFNVLTDPDIGSFDKNNSIMLLGKNATTPAISKALYEQVVLNRNEDDIVLVFFAGHGIILEQQNKSYLGASDTKISDLISDPLRGISMGYIHRNIFSVSPAKQVLMIFDCCHSGGIIPKSLRSSEERGKIKTKTIQRLLYKNFETVAKGRIALVSCPVDAVSHEGGDFENGVYTHFLLEGLKGKAAEISGEVTVNSVSSYLDNNMPANQSPGRYGQEFGKFILTNPGTSLREQNLVSMKINIDKKTRASDVFISLRSTTEPFELLSKNIVKLLGIGSPIKEMGVERRILEALRVSTTAKLVLVLREGQEKNWHITAQSKYKNQETTGKNYLQNLLTELFSHDLNKTVFNLKHNGLYCKGFDGDEIIGTVALIPLKYTYPRTIGVLCGIPSESPILGDCLGIIFRALYFGSQEFINCDPYIVETTILDFLKKFHYLSRKAYQRRFELFRNKLNKMIMFFQPVVYIDPDHMTIDSYEALARDPDTGRVPNDLFATAELWGDHFKVALDKYFLEKATYVYMEQISKKNVGYFGELAVNVYPESLLRSAFYEKAQQIIIDRVIPGNKLVLEISEKVKIPRSKDTDENMDTMDAFKQIIQNKFTKGLNIGFAIDDFGTEHASVARLARLNPGHVKIDQDILLHSFGMKTISYVLDNINREALRPPKVVIEGLDENSLVSLGDLYKINVGYVQGNLTGKPHPEIQKINPNLKEILRKDIQDQP